MYKEMISPKFKNRNIAVPLNAFEASLIAELREGSVAYGTINVDIYFQEGVPVRIEVKERMKSKMLDVKKGLNIEDSRVLDKGEDLIQS